MIIYMEHTGPVEGSEPNPDTTQLQTRVLVMKRVEALARRTSAGTLFLQEVDRRGIWKKIGYCTRRAWWSQKPADGEHILRGPIIFCMSLSSNLCILPMLKLTSSSYHSSLIFLFHSTLIISISHFESRIRQ
jgi:hypothetical protein